MCLEESGSEQSEENKMTVMVVGYTRHFILNFHGPSLNWDSYTFGKGFLFSLSFLTTIPGTPFEFVIFGEFF